jgi:hypothetical protein
MEGTAWSPAGMTITTDELVRRNANFAAGGAFAGLPFPTNQALRVIGCVEVVEGLALRDATVRSRRALPGAVEVARK